VEVVRRLARSAVCFLVVLVMYWLYLWLLVPWLEPQINFRPGQSVGRRMATTRRSALPAEVAALFPQGSWELRGSC
jgi:hypothetical protein